MAARANKGGHCVQTMGTKYTGEQTTAAKQFVADASRTTDAAVAEGKKDVDKAKAASAGYVEQAKNLTSTAIETAQVQVQRFSLGCQFPQLTYLMCLGLPADSNGWKAGRWAYCVENRNRCRRICTYHGNKRVYRSERSCSATY